MRLTGMLTALFLSASLLVAAPTTASAAPAPSAAAPTAPTVRPSSGCTQRTSARAKVRTGALRVAGTKRSYSVRTPSATRKNRPRPLILAFHGRTEAAKPGIRLRRAWRKKAVTVLPVALRGSGRNGNYRAWPGAPYSQTSHQDFRFVKRLVRRVRATTCVDLRRTYAVGTSNGAGFVALLACHRPRKFAAVGMNAGAFYSRTRRCPRKQERPVPMMEAHSVQDRVVPYTGGTRHGGKLPKIRSWLRKWADRNNARDKMWTTRAGAHLWMGYKERRKGRSARVSHLRLSSGGHRWNNDPIIGKRDLDSVMWRFLRKFRTR